MLRLYVNRHGQNEDNANGILNGHRDRPLTDLGISQAHELAQEIEKAGLAFDVVYTSPLSRSSMTAEIVCTKLGLARPVVLDSLIERNFGAMTGKFTDDIEFFCEPDIVKTETITYFLSPPGAETFPDLLVRANRVLDDIRTLHKKGSILLSTHGDFGKMLYAAYYGIPWQNMLTKFHFGNAELLVLAEDASPSEHLLVKIEQHNH